MSALLRVGIAGLGKMGLPIGRHMMAKGLNVYGYDPESSARANAERLGVRVVSSPRALAEASELVVVLVGFASQVEAVMFEHDGVLAGARPGLIIGMGSTVAPTYARGLVARTQAHDIHLLDMPLARGEKAAEDGDLLVLCGGDHDVFRRCLPVLETFASSVFHLGEFGAGQVSKMVNNLILWASMAANDEGLRLAERLGVPPDTLRQALSLSSAQNWALSTRAEDRPIPWAEKDMSIVLHEADLARISLPLCGTAKEVIKELKIRRGLGMPAE